MERFQRTGAGSGVGLAGIRERIMELGGNFTISSSSAGTTLYSEVPLVPDANPAKPPLVADMRDVSVKQRGPFAAYLNPIL